MTTPDTAAAPRRPPASPVVGVTALALVGVFVPLAPAHAYLDPGSASILTQMIIGGVAGGLVVVKLYWRSFKDWIDRKLGRETKPPNQDDG